MKNRLLFSTVVVCLAAFFATPAMANFPGGIFSTGYNGTSWAVNQNQFTDPTAVYLDGGPHNMNDNGLPVGTYYFQVTDPSGKILLSTDDISCRQVQVVSNGGGQGVIAGPPTGQAPSICTNGWHLDALNTPPAPPGLPLDSNGGDPVQLFPFAATPNNGGVYKVWLTPVGSWAGCSVTAGTPDSNGVGITTNPPDCADSFGFVHGSVKTDNFKINCNTNFCAPPPPSPQSRISGAKYFDVNTANTTDPTKNLAGILEPNDVPLMNWTINIYAGADDTAPLADTQSTDASGSWSSFLTQGTYTVCEVLQIGWTQAGPSPSLYSTPAYANGPTDMPNGVGYVPPGLVVPNDTSNTSNCWQVALGTSDITGLDFGNYLQITGTKHYNTTSDDSGTIIPGWTITITCDAISTSAGYCQNSSSTNVVTTDNKGNYTFQPVGPIVSYTVCEGTLTGWTQSYPTGSTPNVNGAVNSAAYGTANNIANPCDSTVGWVGSVGTATGAGLDFSNYATLAGTKYYSGTTTGLNGWTIDLNELTPSSQTIPTTTANGGKYSFVVPAFPFTGNVCEVLQPGWTETSPSPLTNNGCYSYSLNGLTPTVVPAANSLNFYNNIQISGTKHYDTAGNDSGPGIPGFTINITYTPAGGNQTTTSQVTTGADGAYSFTFTGPITGSYTVSETLPNGWTQSYPAAPGTWTGTPGTTAGTGLDFGNYVKVNGTKYYANTTTGLGGWTINLLDLTPVVRATATTATTTGAYYFVVPTFPFTGNICEVQKSGWTETSPTTNNGCYAYSLTTTTVPTGPSGPFDFRNVINLSGTKFYDLNLDMIQDNGESAIGGFKIAIYSCLGTGCTVGTTPSYVFTSPVPPIGTFTWPAPTPITNFKVCEVLPSTGGWTETTTPACYTGTVGGTNQYALNFGNVCEGTGVAPYTQGFWSNNNGSALLKSTLNYPGWASSIDSFNNNTDTGWSGFLSFVPKTSTTTYLSKFLTTNATTDYNNLNGNLLTVTTSANGANMLSTQLVTMELNTLITNTVNSSNPAPKVNNNALMKVGTAAQLLQNGCPVSVGGASLIPNGAGYATILSVEQFANQLLLANMNTTGVNSARSCQVFIQTALNNANNNRSLTIIQPSACSFTTPY